MRFFDENEDNNEKIQHLILFREAQEEDENNKNKRLPHFTLIKIQNNINKNNNQEIILQSREYQ